VSVGDLPLRSSLPSFDQVARAFSFAAARAWNGLPFSVTSSVSLPVIRKNLNPTLPVIATFYYALYFHLVVFGGFMCVILIQIVYFIIRLYITLQYKGPIGQRNLK